jgi:hypothetical protein
VSNQGTPERRKFTITAYREKTGAKASPELLQLRKTQLEINGKITKALSTGPKTVPELAKDTGYPSRKVLWYVMTYYKYGLVMPAGKTDEGYFRYALKDKK